MPPNDLRNLSGVMLSSSLYLCLSAFKFCSFILISDRLDSLALFIYCSSVSPSWNTPLFRKTYLASSTSTTLLPLRSLNSYFSIFCCSSTALRNLPVSVILPWSWAILSCCSNSLSFRLLYGDLLFEFSFNIFSGPTSTSLP